MIDGVKISCKTDPKSWLHCSLLQFQSLVNESTGEIVKGKRYAVHKGLRFEMINSRTSDVVHTLLNGSLAKYWNNGEHNGIDFTHANFCDTLTQLEQYAINANDAQLQGFEFGVNISLPFPVSTVLKSIKSYKGNDFVALKIAGVNVGYYLSMQQYIIKIYDKGKQINKPFSNLLRIEIKVNKMQYVHGLAIDKLADLKRVEVWQSLTDLLLRMWDTVIYIPTKVDYKAMPCRTQKKFLRYMNADYWTGLNKVQRHRSTKHLNALLEQYSPDKSKEVIRQLIAEKLEKLASIKGNLLTKCNTENIQQKNTPKMKPFNPLDKQCESRVKRLNL